MNGAILSIGYALFLATAILSFVGAFVVVMSARLVTRLFTVHW